MKTDLITIFNQLTSSELADYNLFSDIIENHYEKFRYLYSLINNLNLSKVKTINCKTKEYGLKVYIEPFEIKYANDIIFNINSNKHNYIFSDYFDLDLCEDNGILKIKISMMDGQKESDIYANRFI